MQIFTKYMPPESIIRYIQTLPRVKQPALTNYHKNIILGYRCFKLITDFDISQIISDTEGYGTADERIKRIDDLDYNIINRYKTKPTDPIVVDSYNSIIDGMHRLAYLRRHNIKTYNVYKGFSLLNQTS